MLNYLSYSIVVKEISREVKSHTHSSTLTHSLTPRVNVGLVHMATDFDPSDY